MTGYGKARSQRIPCSECPLSALPHFRPHEAHELPFLMKFKSGELNVDARATILAEGTHSPHLFTVLSGWAFRYKTLEDGRRQILNYALPGDLIGLQGTLMKEMQHSVEALTPMLLCMFQRDRLPELFANHPGLAFDLTWIASREEQLLDEHLLSIGRRTALERAAYLLAFLATRARAVGLASAGKTMIPFTQQHIADTLGLSLVHTNKTLRKLAALGFVRWREAGCEVGDADALAEIAHWTPVLEPGRPFV